MNACRRASTGGRKSVDASNSSVHESTRRVDHRSGSRARMQGYRASAHGTFSCARLIGNVPLSASSGRTACRSRPGCESRRSHRCRSLQPPLAILRRRVFHLASAQACHIEQAESRIGVRRKVELDESGAVQCRSGREFFVRYLSARSRPGSSWDVGRKRPLGAQGRLSR